MLNKERWEQIESIYHAALQREPRIRDEFLHEACDGDDELRNEVGSLLEFDGPAAEFIETPALELEAKSIAVDPRVDELPFSDIGPYRVESIISHGGMGEVFLAVDTRLGRKVAIKLLATEFTADADRILRFKQEARTTSTLSHPNIVTLFEIGEINDRHYIVTEYVEGPTLREFIAAAPAQQIDIKEALSITTQVVDALNAAHQAGIVHRDIKPENVIVRADGLVKVLDFGIAKLIAADSDNRPDHLTTKTGIIMGTASYMSPEQVRGQKVDHRADIFSIGAVLYEMISGERPFAGDTMADVMAAVLVKEPKPLETLVSSVPPALQRIVERCLQKQPEDRFQTASDLAFSLKELSATITTTPHAGSKQPRSTWNRRRLFGFLAITVFAIVVAIIAAKVSDSRNESTATAVAKPPRPASGGNATRLVWFDRSGNQLGTVGPVGEYSGPALSPSEDRVVVAMNDAKLNTRDLWIFELNSTNAVRLTSEPSDDLNPVWTADGRWIIYTSHKNGVRDIYRRLADGTGGPELLIAGGPNNVEDASHNGQRLMFNTGSRQEVQPNLASFSLSDRRPRSFRTTTWREDGGRFSPDDRWIAYRSFESSQTEVYVRGINSTGSGSEQRWMASNGQGRSTQPMWRGDGKELYFLEGKTLTAVAVTPNGNSLQIGPPTALFSVNIEDNERRNRFTVTKDGQRFLVIVRGS